MKLSLQPLAIVPPFALPFALLFATGCGAAGQASKPAVEFPSRQELAQLPSKPAPADAFHATDVVVDAWTFEADPGASDAAYDDASAWGTMLRDIVAPNAARVTLSSAMRCASTEIARFYVKHHGLPSESLRRFTLARCGGTTSDATPIVWSAKADPKITDEALVAELRPKLTDALAKRFAGGHHLAAIATAREGDQFVAVTTIADDQAHLDNAPRSVDAQRRVTLRGAARGTFTSFTGMINRGEYGFAACETDARVAPPRFAITCNLAEGDHFAWVEILAGQRGRVLLSNVADLIVHEGDGSDIAYKARSAGPPALVKGAGDFDAALLARLNAVRARAKLPPLSLSTRQSAEHARLAGTLIDAEHSHDEKAADRIAIGLLAGWDVDGLIRDGRFFMAQVAPTRDATAWLDYVLERPAGRGTLLDPASRQIAIGPAIPEGVPALGAAVTTYALFESRDHTAEEKRVLAAIDAARAGRDAPAVTRITGIPELEGQARLVLDKGRPPMDALQAVLDAASTRSRKRIQGYVLETQDLDHFEVPRQLLGKGPLNIGIAVTHHKADGAAWGQFVLFLVVIDPEITGEDTTGTSL